MHAPVANEQSVEIVGDALVDRVHFFAQFLHIAIEQVRVEDARSALSEGQEVEARFVGVDRRNRTISLSIRAKDEKDEQQAMRDYADTDASTGTTSLGELLKEQIDASDRNN